MKIKNSKELEEWLFQHEIIKGNICDEIIKNINGKLIKVAYVDRNTGEKFDIEYIDDKI